MTHNTSPTSLAHFKTYDAKEWYDLILAVMRDGEAWCIADLKEELQSRVAWTVEKSTISPRMLELRNMGKLVYAGKKPSKATGIRSIHWCIKRDTLF